MSGPMVRAILAGTKTQTRRIVTDESLITLHADGAPAKAQPKCKHGQPGDRLWVRETFTTTQFGTPVYRADATDKTGARWTSITPGDPKKEVTWKPSIHMPRWASRITIEITQIRVERLQEISESDAWAEGIEETLSMFDSKSQAEWAKRIGCCIEDGKPQYAQLWESINGPGSWSVNPWVWVIEFKRIKP